MRFVIVRYALALLSVPLFAAPPPSVILSRYDAHPPVFISASAMVAADGTMAAVVPEDWRQRMQHLAEVFSQNRDRVSALGLSSAAPCQGGMLSDESSELWVDTSTRHDAVVNAHAIVAGTIRTVTPGFFQSGPGSLIELDDLDRIKADTFYNRLGDTLYLRLPYAQFVIDGVEYCQESGPGKYAPKVGDRILVFAYLVPGDMSGTLVYARSSELIVQPSQGAIHIPKALSFFDDPTATIATIATGIRSEFSHRDEPVGRRAQ